MRRTGESKDGSWCRKFLMEREKVRVDWEIFGSGESRLLLPPGFLMS